MPCNTQELKYFFQQKEILQIKELYLSPTFVQLVKTFNGYEDEISKLYKNHQLKEKILSWIPLYKPKEIIIKQDGDKFFIETKN